MDNHLLIALVGAVVNAVLVLLVPCAMQKTNLPFSKRIGKAFGKNRDVIVSSSVVVAVVIFISMKIVPEVRQQLPAGVVNFLQRPFDLEL